MPNLFTRQVIAAGICGVAAFIYHKAGETLENPQVVQSTACAIATICAGLVTIETAQKTVKIAAPVVSKGLKTIAKQLKKKPE